MAPFRRRNIYNHGFLRPARRHTLYLVQTTAFLGARYSAMAGPRGLLLATSANALPCYFHSTPSNRQLSQVSKSSGRQIPNRVGRRSSRT